MLKSLLTISGFTLLSRILGFLRDIIASHFLGASRLNDLWVVAFRFPNMFRRVLGEGAFNNAFVPMYSGKLAEDGRGAAARFGGKVMVMLSLFLAVIMAVSFIFMEQLIWVTAWGIQNEADLATAVSLSRITVAYLFFICLVAAVSAMLNSHKKFGAPAFAYVFLNIVFIAGLLGFADRESGNAAVVMSWCVFIAGFLQLGIVIYSAWKNGIRVKLAKPTFDDEIKKLACLMGPGVVSAAVQQINLLVGQSVAAFQEGGISYIYYADRINQLPLGLIGIAFGIVLLPDLTQKLKSNEVEGAQKSLETGMTMAMFVAIPAMIGMMVLAEPILFGLFKGGKFTADHAKFASQALFAFALSSPAYIMVRVLQPGYFARENTKTPMHFTLISAFVNIVLCLVALSILGKDGPLHLGCAIATTIAGWVNVALLIWGLRKETFLHLTKVFWLKLGRMLLASLLMGAGVWFAADLLHEYLMQDSRLMRLLVLGLIGSAGIFLYFTAAFFMKAMTPSELKAGFKK